MQSRNIVFSDEVIDALDEIVAILNERGDYKWLVDGLVNELCRNYVIGHGYTIDPVQYDAYDEVDGVGFE